MVRLVVYDAAEHIFFSEGLIPSSEMLLRHFQQQADFPIPVDEMPCKEEERKAWLLTLDGYRLAHKKHCAVDMARPLETWIIGRAHNSSGTLERWFNAADDNYRLLIHRFPLISTGTPESRVSSKTCWDEMYDLLNIGLHRMPSAELSAPIMNLLYDVHQAYRNGPSALEIFEATRHSYAHSVGPIEGCEH